MIEDPKENPLTKEPKEDSVIKHLQGDPISDGNESNESTEMYKQTKPNMVRYRNYKCFSNE